MLRVVGVVDSQVIEAPARPATLGDPLPEGWLQATCNNYKLDKFLTAKIDGDDIDGRKQSYMEYIQRSIVIVSEMRNARRMKGSLEVSVRDYVAKMLSEDDSFTAFVLDKRGPSTELGNEEKWKPIWLAAAGAVMQSYRDAVAEGSWPP
jgi:hypothetical protein